MSTTPNLNVYSNYTNKVPGKWLLMIDAGNGKMDIHSDELACSAHVYPIDVTESFRSSVTKTLQNLTDDIQVTDAPGAASTVAAQGYAGVIRVKLEQLQPRLEFLAGFWTTKARADMEIDGGLIVDGPSGRLLGTEASGHGSDEQSGGCPEGAKALGRATEEAMKSFLGEIGERFSNAPQLRAPAK